MTEQELLANRATGTPFEILYSRPAPPPKTAQEIKHESENTLKRDRMRAHRLANKEPPAAPVHMHSLSKKHTANWKI
jgi:hypothetical protein